MTVVVAAGLAAVVVVASSGVVRGVGTVHGPVGIGCGQRVAGWMGIDQPGGQQDAFAGYLLYPLPPSANVTYTSPGFPVTYSPHATAAHLHRGLGQHKPAPPSITSPTPGRPGT